MRNVFSGLLTRQLFKWHIGVFCGAIFALNLFDLRALFGDWIIPSSIIWGFALFAQYLIIKIMTADEKWAAERSDDLRFKSYDIGHIQQIKGTHQDTNGSAGPESSDTQKQS